MSAQLLIGEWVRVRLPGYEPFIGVVVALPKGVVHVEAERGGRWQAQPEHCRRVRREWVEID